MLFRHKTYTLYYKWIVHTIVELTSIRIGQINIYLFILIKLLYYYWRKFIYEQVYRKIKHKRYYDVMSHGNLKFDYITFDNLTLCP